MKKYMFNTILVHVARTWERVRMTTAHEEMPLDNIESVDTIVQIADEILANDIIQGFIKACKKGSEDNYWVDNTTAGMSDWYIEEEAEKIIRKEYL